MLLLYELALALFIGLGPLFILCLLFDQTKQLFQRWLFYGIGTMFSMAVLAAMISIALDMVILVSAAFWTSALIDKYLLDPNGSVDIDQSGAAVRRHGPDAHGADPDCVPMAAMFFQGTLNGFMAYSQIGGSPVAAAPGPNGQPPGSYRPAAPTNSEESVSSQSHAMPKIAPGTDSSVHTPGSLGNAPVR